MINKEVKKQPDEKKKENNKKVDEASGTAMDRIVIRDKTTNAVLLNRRG